MPSEQFLKIAADVTNMFLKGSKGIAVTDAGIKVSVSFSKVILVYLYTSDCKYMRTCVSMIEGLQHLFYEMQCYYCFCS